MKLALLKREKFANAVGRTPIEPVKLGNVLNQDYAQFKTIAPGRGNDNVRCGTSFSPFDRFAALQQASAQGNASGRTGSNANSTIDSTACACASRTSFCQGVVYPVIPTR